MWRLNEMATLPEISKFSSVSGGSILTGLMAVRWRRLTFQDGIATNFQEEIATPIWKFCSHNIDRTAILSGLVAGTWKLQHSYQKHIVGTTTLRDLPDYPEFVFNATHIETGRNCTISKRAIHTWRLGDIYLPDLRLARAITASSACPPAFPPVILKTDPDSFTKSAYANLFERHDLKNKLSLTDGGAYDNLGLHAVRHCPTILVSDGSAPLRATRGRWFARQFNHRVMRPMEASLEQTRALRRQAIMDQFITNKKKGTLWMAGTSLSKYPIQSPFPVSPGWNEHLATVRTRLNAFTDTEKARLINWGYVLCDLSMRSYYRPKAPTPNALPFPEVHFMNSPATDQ